jgi:hypothetical protein
LLHGLHVYIEFLCELRAFAGKVWLFSQFPPPISRFSSKIPQDTYYFIISTKLSGEGILRTNENRKINPAISSAAGNTGSMSSPVYPSLSLEKALFTFLCGWLNLCVSNFKVTGLKSIPPFFAIDVTERLGVVGLEMDFNAALQGGAI